MQTRHLKQHLVLGAAFSACASSPATSQLVDARRAYDQASASGARTRAPGELADAHVALDRAEQAHDDSPGSRQEIVLADRATRKARIAEAHGDSAVEHPVVVARTRPRAEVVDNTPPDRMYERSEHVKVRTNDRRANASLQSLAQVANVKETPRGAVITLSGSLLFPSGQEDVSAIGNQSLDQVAHALAQQPSDTSFKVEGYTDSTGSESQNLELSNQRAQAVADRLAEAGIDASRVRAEGRGEAQPIADNTTPEGRATNRRIEIVMSRP